MDASSLNKLTVPQLKKELKERGLPLGGVKADLVARLHAAFMPQQTQSFHQQTHLQQQQQQQQLHQQQQQQQPQHLIQQQLQQHMQQPLLQLDDLQQQIQQTLQQTPQQLYTPQSNQFYQLPLLTTNLSPLLPRTASKSMSLMLGLVDPRDRFGAVVSTAEDDVLLHEGYEWAFYCTKSMDYQVWATLYFKCLKKQMKKHGLVDDVPSVEASIEFPTGKKVKGVLHKQNQHRLVITKDANTTTLTKTFGFDNKETIANVKVTLRTLTEAEAHQVDQTTRKKPKVESEKEKEKEKDLCADWGVYGQMDSDDENRSEYESSEYSSSSESDHPD